MEERKSLASKRGSKKSAASLGGRPRVRTGNEIVITVEFQRETYAQLCGLIELRKERARSAGTPVWKESKRELFVSLWDAYWQSLSPGEKRAARGTRKYRDMRRG